MASPLLSIPPECGRRFLPMLVDEISKTNGSRPFVSIPRSSELRDGYVDISYSAFAKAVNRCCWCIEKTIGRSEISKVLFYIGPLDLRYLLFLLAASKTGHVIFFSSHRNSLEAHLSLLDASNCHTILLPDGAPAVVKQILALRPMEVVPIPSLDSFLSDSEMAHDYRFQGTFDELKDKTFVVLHTSGSTGIPKPVFVTHGTFASNDAHQLIPSLGGRPTFVDYARGKRLFISMPLFHAANIGMVACAIFSGLTCVLPPPGPLAAGTVDMIHTYGNVHGSLFPPSMVVDIYTHSDYLENMIQRLDFVAYVGGTLTAEIGDHFSRKMKLITLFGTTENMYFPLEIHDKPVDWQYMKFSSFLGNIFRPWKDGLDELVVLRNEEKSAFQGVFSTFPEINEYATKDLYERHPAREDFWRFSGRSDDIICFNNAEKLNPITMEAIISAHPGVNSAIIGGNGQFQASLLIEPRTYPADFTEEQRLIDEIWPTIVKANRDCPAHGRIMRDFVMLADLERPIPKAGKTTVQRYATLQMYASEFEAIYKKRTHSSPQVIESTRTSHSTKEETALPDTRNEASEEFVGR